MIRFLAALLLPLFLAPAWGATTINVSPNGGGDDLGNIQAALNAVGGAGGGVVYLTPGNFHLSGGMVLPAGPIALVCAGRGVVDIIATQPNITMIGFAWPAGKPNEPHNYEIRDCTLNANLLPGVTGIKLSGGGPVSDISTYLGEVNLSNLNLYFMAQAIDVRRSMGTTLRNIHMEGGIGGFYSYDNGELIVDTARAESTAGVAFLFEGSTDPNDHAAEGISLANIVTNGAGLGMVIRNQGWGTATGLSLTTSTAGPALTFQGSVGNWNFAASQFAGSNNGPAQQPGVLFDVGTYPQWNGPFYRITFTGGQVSNSSYPMILRGVNLLVDGMMFVANSNVDIILDQVFDSIIAHNTLVSAPTSPPSARANVYEFGSSGNNLFDGNVVRYPIVLGGSGSVQSNTRITTH